jgi:hypothetical protein
MKFMPAPRYFRRATFVVVALVVAFSLFVRAQQYLFRQQVERLHREILALQLHSGNFADIQRLQREWGAYAHYNGPCTPHHCIYQIILHDVLDDWFRNPSDFRLNFPAIQSLLTLKAYTLFGGRPGFAIANVRVRDNRMWGADFSVGILTYPGKGRNEGEPYVVLAGIQSGSRLSGRNDSSSDALRRGFRTESGLNCLGCEFVEVFLTPQTEVRDIERFNQFNFSCITAIWACQDPVDIASDAWKQSLQDKQKEAPPDEAACSLSSTILAREADDVALVKVLSFIAPSDPDVAQLRQYAIVQIIQPLKNARVYRTADTLEFFVPSGAIRAEDDTGRVRLTAGNEYFFLYRQPRPFEVDSFPSLGPCRGLLNTPGNAAAVSKGIVLDPSNGESYDFRSEPYAEK